jgi:hypothetical protein
MATVLGLPLILDDEEVNEPVTIRHDPREPGHPLHVQRDYNRPMNIRHGGNMSGFGSPDPSMGAFGNLGAYYPSSGKPVGAGSAIAATVSPVAGLGMGPLSAAGLGMGTIALIGLAYVAALGASGYYIGGKLAPSPKQEEAYKWIGAVSNVVLPGLSIAGLALVSAIQGDD